MREFFGWGGVPGDLFGGGGGTFARAFLGPGPTFGPVFGPGPTLGPVLGPGPTFGPVFGPGPSLGPVFGAPGRLGKAGPGPRPPPRFGKGPGGPRLGTGEPEPAPALLGGGPGIALPAEFVRGRGTVGCCLGAVVVVDGLPLDPELVRGGLGGGAPEALTTSVGSESPIDNDSSICLSAIFFWTRATVALFTAAVSALIAGAAEEVGSGGKGLFGWSRFHCSNCAESRTESHSAHQVSFFFVWKSNLASAFAPLALPNVRVRNLLRIVFPLSFFSTTLWTSRSAVLSGLLVLFLRKWPRTFFFSGTGELSGLVIASRGGATFEIVERLTSACTRFTSAEVFWTCTEACKFSQLRSRLIARLLTSCPPTSIVAASSFRIWRKESRAASLTKLSVMALFVSDMTEMAGSSNLAPTFSDRLLKASIWERADVYLMVIGARSEAAKSVR